MFCSLSCAQVIADHLSSEEAAGIKEGFELMDSGNNGKINIDELRVGLQKLGHQIPDGDVQILMEAVSIFHFIWNLFCLFHNLLVKKQVVCSLVFSNYFRNLSN